MNAYEKATALGLTGTDQEIIDQMKALTANNVPRNDLILWLSNGDYWSETPAGMTGDLTAAYDASSGALRKKFNRVWRWLYKRDDLDELKTTKPTQADDLLSIMNKISTMNGALRNEYFDLGGGAPYRQTTLQEFDDQRTAAANVVTMQNLRSQVGNDHVNTPIALEQAVVDPALYPAAVRALADAYAAAATALGG